MKSTIYTTAILILSFAAPPVLADEASKAAKVEEFFRLAKIDEMLRNVLALSSSRMQGAAIQEMLGVKLPPEAQKRVESLQGKVTALLTEALAWEKLKPEYVKIYSEAFTEEQIGDIVAFHKSKTGQALVAKNPELMAKSSEIVRKKLAESQSEMRKLIQEFIEQAAQEAKP
ncbi:MAG: DUF2059 domain-containing protein [Acidobacteria bacterium]|nr:DUF2059 domain-containing protein [Acidobacteriota bacterium]